MKNSREVWYLLPFWHTSWITWVILQILVYNFGSRINLNAIPFYFTIGHTSGYIEHYLWGISEFEIAINHITVDFAHSFLPLSTTTLALTFARRPGCEPLPSVEGCGLCQCCPGPLRSEDRRPSPFQRDVGGSFSHRQCVQSNDDDRDEV